MPKRVHQGIIATKKLLCDLLLNLWSVHCIPASALGEFKTSIYLPSYWCFFCRCRQFCEMYRISILCTSLVSVSDKPSDQ